MKKFLLKTILFIAVFLVLDNTTGYLLSLNRPSDYKQFLNSKKKFFDSVNTVDMLVIGSSCIADALDPRSIERNIKLKTYNLGIYHSSPFQNYYVTKVALEKLQSKPRIIVLGANPDMFEREMSRGKYTPLILPKSKSFELISNSVEGFDASFFLNFIREKYLFESLINKLIGKSYKETREIKDVYNGHLKFFNQIPNSEWHKFSNIKESELKKVQVDYFEKTIQLALKNNITVVVVRSPIWKKKYKAILGTNSYRDYSSKIFELSKRYDLEIYDSEFTTGMIEYQQSDFLNSHHLNYRGSLKFTNDFCKFLKKQGIINPI